jgi:ArsR family transcriptional regulator
MSVDILFAMIRTAADRDTALLARFQAIAEETRLRIVQLLSGGERCVCELQAELGAAQSRLSFHLKKLKEAGVVSDRREGRWIYYSLAPEALEEMRAFLGEVKETGGGPRPSPLRLAPGRAVLWRDPPCCG